MTYCLQGNGIWGVEKKTAATYKGLLGTAWFQLKEEVTGLFREEIEGVETWQMVNSRGHSGRVWRAGQVEFRYIYCMERVTWS